MTLLERERVETKPRVEEPMIERKPGPRRTGWMWVLAVLAVAAVATVAIVVALSGGEESAAPVTEAPTTEAPVALEMPSIYTDDELALIRLAAVGYIPKEAVPWDTIEMKQLVARGLLPEAALRPDAPVVEPVFTHDEMASLELISTGRIPKGSVDGEVMYLKQLISQGLVPREILPSEYYD